MDTLQTEAEIVVIDLDDSDPRVGRKADTSFQNFFVLTESINHPEKAGEANPKVVLPYMCYDTADGVPVSCDGVFRHKRLTQQEAVQVGIFKARATAQTGGLDWNYDAIAERLAYCQVAIVEAPPWWSEYIAGNGPRRMDSQILSVVYTHMRQWEDNFRNRALEKRRAGTSGDSSRP